jgi:hypothetical protein
MVALPIFNAGPIPSLLGIMAFPEDLDKANACASWILCKAWRGPFLPSQIAKEAADFAPLLADFNADWK